MKKPHDQIYLGSEALDHLARMNLELLSELWIMRDRLAILEQVLVDKRLLDADAVESYEVDAAFQAKLAKLRSLIVENVVGAPYRSQLSVGELTERARAFAVNRPW